MVDILFVTDYVCPYCLVAKEALDRALKSTGIEARITLQPHELTPAPMPQVDTYHDEVRRSHYTVLEEPCRVLSLPMKLPPEVVPRPRTQLAFEGLFFAQEHGEGDRWSDLMYRAYFIEEMDIGSVDVLCSLAQRIGLDGEALRTALENGTYTAREKEAVTYTREVLKPRGVPTIYINGVKVMPEKYTEEEMAGFLLGAQSEGGMACGPDGCGMA